MRRAKHNSSKFVHRSITVMAALVLAVVAITAHGEDPSPTPGGSDGHLTGLVTTQV